VSYEERRQIAVLYRRAGWRLRERTAAVTPPPWVVDHDAEAMTFDLRSKIAEVDYQWQRDIVSVHTPDAMWPDFDYMAMLHPPVALKLADLFDKCASTEAEYLRGNGRTPCGGEAADVPRWLEDLLVPLARAILREPDPSGEAGERSDTPNASDLGGSE
jgi:hypothetical protein